MEKGAAQAQSPSLGEQGERAAARNLRLESQERGSLVSLTEEEQEGDGSSIGSQVRVCHGSDLPRIINYAAPSVKCQRGQSEG